MLERKITRGEFLKFMAAGATVGFLGMFVNLNSFLKEPATSANKSNTRSIFPAAAAQSLGSWELGPNSTITPIHTTMLHTGKILVVAGSGYHVSNMNGPYQASLLDVNTGTETRYTLSEDIFCGGHNHLPNGNILFTGGTLAYDTANPEGRFQGLASAYEFDVYTSSFHKLTSMRHGRWYPTQVVLPDGKVLILGGLDEFGTRNALVEIYDPTSKSFSILYDPRSSRQYTPGFDSELPGAGAQTYGGVNQGTAPFVSLYPRMHLMPSGLVSVVGFDNPIYLIDPTTGEWISGGSSVYSWRGYGTSFLLPLHNIASERGKVLLVSGELDIFTPATESCEMLDFDAGTDTRPQIRPTASLNYGRHYPIPIHLPDGKMVVFGGTTGPMEDYIRTPEMFDPVTETWSTLPDASINRTYHSTGLLLPDGRVFIASSTPNMVVWERRTEIFSPSYIFATRPTINGRVSTAPYGGTIRIPTPDADDISSVSLVRLMNSTHHYDPNMRFVWLQVIKKESAAVLAAAPLNPRIAPPGHYMIHVLNSKGIPSAAQIIQIPGIIC